MQFLKAQDCLGISQIAVKNDFDLESAYRLSFLLGVNNGPKVPALRRR